MCALLLSLSEIIVSEDSVASAYAIVTSIQLVFVPAAMVTAVEALTTAATASVAMAVTAAMLTLIVINNGNA